MAAAPPVRLADYTPWPFGLDQGIFAWVGDTVLRGGWPYRDAWEIKGPVTHFFYALAQALFGRDVWGLRVLDLSLLAEAAVAVRDLHRVAHAQVEQPVVAAGANRPRCARLTKRNAAISYARSAGCADTRSANMACPLDRNVGKSSISLGSDAGHVPESAPSVSVAYKMSIQCAPRPAPVAFSTTLDAFPPRV